MRILCINYEYPPIGGGGGRACEGLVRALAAAGHEIDVVTAGMPNLPALEEHGTLRVHRVPCWRRFRHYTTTPEMLTFLWPMYRKARELIAKQPYDINHTHFVVPSGVVSYMLWKRTGLPYVITCHGSDVPGYNPDRFGFMHRLIRPVWRRIVRGSAGLTSPSTFLQGLIRRFVDVDATVIPYGCHPSTQNGHDAKLNRLLVVTRMFERKGVQFLLRALVNHPVDWEVCIAGDGPYLPALKAEASRLSSRVKFLGHVEGQALLDLYNSSRIFVLPSIQENFPVALLEAMQAGCAVVTTTAPGCAEVVGEAGLKTPVADPEALGAALDRLVRCPAEVERLRKLGPQRVATFSWPSVAGRFEELFQSCAAR